MEHIKIKTSAANKYAVVMLVAMVTVTTVTGAPTTVDISNPCQPFETPVLLSSLLRGMTLPAAATLPPPEPHHVHFERIRRGATEVKGMVLALKTRFAQERFGDSGLTVKLEEGGLMLFGMPRVDLHLQDESDLNAERKVRDTFQNVSTSAWFIMQARQGEITYEHSVYDTHYLDIERGLYAILCNLHSYLASQSLQVDEEMVREAIHRTGFPDPNESSYRRIRDFIILRDLDRLLFAITTGFQSLIDIYRSTSK